MITSDEGTYKGSMGIMMSLLFPECQAGFVGARVE